MVDASTGAVRLASPGALPQAFAERVRASVVMQRVCRKLTKQDMAKVVGASREMVTRVMKDLETSGQLPRKTMPPLA